MFKDGGFESTVLKTWTPPKPSGPACKRKLARFNRLLYEKQEELQETKFLEKGNGKTSSVVEACGPLRKGDEEPYVDMRRCFSEENVSMDLQGSNISALVEIPPQIFC